MASPRDRLSETIPDIYNCLVCMEHLLDRNPRFLACHHYYCQSCLRKLTKRSRISCPTCRAVTKVTNDDVTKLTMNAVLVQMMEREQYIRSIRDKLLENPPEINCEFCSEEKPVNKCKDCDRVLCDSCTKNHNKMQTFKGHNISKICQDHLDNISHICMKCLKGVCSKCIVLDHGDHENVVEKYPAGIKYLKSNLRKMYMDIPGRISKIDNYVKDIEAIREKIGQERCELQTEKEELVKRIEEIDEKLTQLRDEGTTCLERINVVKEHKRTYSQLSHSTRKMYKSTDKDEDILSKYIQVKKSMESLRAETDKLDTNILASPIVQEETKWLPKAELITELTERGRFKLQYPTSIRVFKDNSIIYSDNIVDIFTTVDSGGNVETTFSTHTDSVRAVDVYNNKIYLAQSKQIYCINEYNTPDESWTRYKPEIEDISKIAVVNDSLILCTEHFAGKLFGYNQKDNITKLLLVDLNKPSYINVARTQSGSRFILSLQDDVHIYDDSWMLINTIGQKKGALKEPRDTASVPGGLLVADYRANKISFYNHSGKLIKHILTRDDGIVQPSCMVFCSPFLWVAQGYRQNAALKCFRLLH